MERFIEGVDRGQGTLFPERLEDWVDEDNPVRVIDNFVDKLDLCGLGFGRAQPEATGRRDYRPAMLLKLYIYDYLNRGQSSRRLEREAGRNVEVMWLTLQTAITSDSPIYLTTDKGLRLRNQKAPRIDPSPQQATLCFWQFCIAGPIEPICNSLP